jgi:sarcosine oxidase subunit alpha
MSAAGPESHDAEVRLEINGVPVSVPEGANVAAAVARATPAFRRAVQGGLRGPLCGMGVCFECRVRIDARDHQRACMVLARPGMRVQTLV